MPRVSDALVDRVTARRRTATGAGLAILMFATAGAVSACIFDKGDYQGGGRIEKVPMPEDDGDKDEAPPPPTTPTGSGSPDPDPDPDPTPDDAGL